MFSHLVKEGDLLVSAWVAHVSQTTSIGLVWGPDSNPRIIQSIPSGGRPASDPIAASATGTRSRRTGTFEVVCLFGPERRS